MRSTTVKQKKQSGGAGAALESLLGVTKLETATPQARIVEARTDECRMWKFADRTEDDPEHVSEIAESIKSKGQIQPAVARLCNDPDAPEIKYEIIVGNVRFQACKLLGMTLQLQLKNHDDRAANRVMFDENEKRKGISAYRRSLHLARCLSEGLYESKKELSAHLEISPSTLSYYLAFASLPETIVAALGNMKSIKLAMGYRIAQAVEKLSEEEVLALIPEIKAGNLSAAQLEAMVVNPVAKAKTNKDPKEPLQKTPGPELPEPDKVDQLPQVTPGDSTMEPEENDGVSNDDGSGSTEPSHTDSFTQPVINTPTSSNAKAEVTAHPNNEESDLSRANHMNERISESLSVNIDRTKPEAVIVELGLEGPLYGYLLTTVDCGSALANHLKQCAADYLELEVPLNLFDEIAVE